QHPLGAVGVDAVAVHDRAAARAAIVAVHVGVVGRVLEPPGFLAGQALAAGQPLPVAVAVEDVHAVVGDGRGAVALPQLDLPDDPQALRRPGGRDTLLGRNAVAGRAEEPRPIAAR